MAKVAILGSPNRGKSVFGQAVSEVANLPRFSACPDGETPEYWQALKAGDRDQARQIKDANKGAWTADYAIATAQAVKAIRGSVLVDLGGMPSTYNRLIASQCDHAIILAADLHEALQWSDFAASAGLKIIALVFTDRDPSVDPSDRVVVGLYRGTPADKFRAVKAVAKRITG